MLKIFVSRDNFCLFFLLRSNQNSQSVLELCGIPIYWILSTTEKMRQKEMNSFDCTQAASTCFPNNLPNIQHSVSCVFLSFISYALTFCGKSKTTTNCSKRRKSKRTKKYILKTVCCLSLKHTWLRCDKHLSF